MLLLKSFRKPSRSVDDAPCGSHLSTPNVPLLSLRLRVCHPKTRIYVRLLGPCFKTGQITPFRQHPKVVYETPNRWHCVAPYYLLLQVIQCCYTRGQGTSPKARPATPQSSPKRSRQAITLTTEIASHLPAELMFQSELMLTCTNHKCTRRTLRTYGKRL